MTDLEWHTEELVPACRCGSFRLQAGAVLAHGKGDLYECDNCGKFERVFTHPDGPEKHVWIGLAAGMAELHFTHGVTVPAFEGEAPQGRSDD